VPVTSGTRTLKDATNEALRDWVTHVTTTHYSSARCRPIHFQAGGDFQSVIGREARAQMLEQVGVCATVVACVAAGRTDGHFHGVSER